MVSFSTLLYGQTGYEKTSVNQVDNSLKILSSSDEEIEIELSIGNYLKRSVKIDGNIYYSVNLFGESWIKKKEIPNSQK